MAEGDRPEERIESLELRLMEQEVALERLTRTVLEQERELELQRARIRRMEEQLTALSPSDIAPESEEAQPPHY
ncbi:MAG TPA: SlyX family protein [Thiotrichales bacterium]|nr:SlyX family protein [Thiotrichales bacterium]